MHNTEPLMQTIGSSEKIELTPNPTPETKLDLIPDLSPEIPAELSSIPKSGQKFVYLQKGVFYTKSLNLLKRSNLKLDLSSTLSLVVASLNLTKQQ